MSVMDGQPSSNALKRDTHDVRLMIAPWTMKAWKLKRDPAASNSFGYGCALPGESGQLCYAVFAQLGYMRYQSVQVH